MKLWRLNFLCLLNTKQLTVGYAYSSTRFYRYSLSQEKNDGRGKTCTHNTTNYIQHSLIEIHFETLDLVILIPDLCPDRAWKNPNTKGFTIRRKFECVFKMYALCDAEITTCPFVLISITPLLCSFCRRPCLSAMTHSCVTSQSAGPSWAALPGSHPVPMYSVISTGPESSAAPLPSARPAPLRCLESWTLWGLSCHLRRITKLWCWQVYDQTQFWIYVPALWPSGAIRSQFFPSVCLWKLCTSLLVTFTSYKTSQLVSHIQVHQERLYQEYSLSRAEEQLKQMEKLLNQQNQSRELELGAMRGEIASLKKVNHNS